MSGTPLPSAEEIMTRLRSVYDDPHAIKGLYPRITKYAGERKTPEGVEMMLLLAIYDYAQDMPPAVETSLLIFVPAFVTALTAAPEATS